MANRDVAGLARFDRETQADQVGAHGVERIGFGIEGDQRRLAQPFNPGRQRLLIGDAFVLALGGQRRVGRGFGIGACLRGRGEAGLGRARGRVGLAAFEFAQGGGEAVAGVELARGRDVAAAQLEFARALVERHVGLDGHQVAVQRQAVERGAQVVADLALDLGGVGHHAIQAVVLGQPFGGGLGPALVDAGHVVDAVAHQGQQVDYLVGAHAELFHHPGFVGDAAGHGVGERDARAHQLGEVLVAGGNGDRDAVGLGLQGQGADDVVALDAGDPQDRETQGLDDLHHRFDLGAQLVGHGRAVGLVLGVHFVPEGRAGGVHHDGGEVRVFLQRGAQHVDDAEQGAGGRAVGRGQRRQGVEGAVEVGRSVDEDEAGHGGGPVRQAVDSTRPGGRA